jgi:ABC-type dipeptide/oligopeptide/nickel transport system ATPase component
MTVQAEAAAPLLQVSNLTTWIDNPGAPPLRPVDDVCLSLGVAKVLGLIGESGSGKSTLALSLMRLVPDHFRLQGKVCLEGEDLLALDEAAMEHRRGSRLAMIQQNPMVSLDPLFTVGSQLLESLHLHLALSSESAHRRAVDLLREVRIPAPETRLTQYPHQMSGGMLQRLVGAIALAGAPRLLIADEPTTALDPTVQARFLDLLDELRQREQLSIVLVTHDMSVAARLADDIAVMYAGRIVEQQTAERLFDAPAHPHPGADCHGPLGHRGRSESQPASAPAHDRRAATETGAVARGLCIRAQVPPRPASLRGATAPFRSAWGWVRCLLAGFRGPP